jgi:signal transduction histidine kinase
VVRKGLRFLLEQQPDVQIDGPVSTLPEPHRTCIYRVIQEALTNCARHANAKQIDITITASPGGVSASIRDDGIGFDPASVRGRGLGVVGMQERVMELNGELNISSHPHMGTVVFARIPAPQEIVTSEPANTVSR